MPDRRLPLSLLAAAAGLALAAQASRVVSARDRGGSAQPVLLEPAPASVLAQPSVFRWTAVPGADAYRLRVGSAPGKHDVLNILAIPGTITSYHAGELPALKPLYARVSAHRGGEWRHAEVRFTAERVAAEWLYPPPGSPEVEAGRPFEWTPVSDETEYRVAIGTAPGVSDVLDRTVTGRTRLDIADLPLGRRLIARLSTRVRDTWYSRDTDFAVALGYRAAEPIHPRPGGRTDARRPFTWEPVPLATEYRLRISATPGGAALFDSGRLGVSSTFVADLPARRTLYATLTTAYTDRTLERRFEFQAEPGAPAEDSFVDAALAATKEVRAMAGPSGAWSRTLLADVASQEHVAEPACVEFALTLMRALGQQHNGLPARLLNTCLLGNGHDCHTLVELYLPRSGRWMLLDPTFAVTARRRDGKWATAGDVSEAVLREDWTSITFLPLSDDTLASLREYYIDYPLLFVKPFGQEPPDADAGPPILRYYERIPFPAKQRGAYAVRCGQAPWKTQVVIDGQSTVLTCNGPDGLSPIRLASLIEEPSERTLELYRPRRFVFPLRAPHRVAPRVAPPAPRVLSAQ